MKKSVTVNGELVKVDFKKHSYTRIHDTENVKAGFEYFNINGKDYLVNSTSTRSSSGRMNTSRTYNGVPFGDNDKDIIQYILNNEQ